MNLQEHWEKVYATKKPEEVSWWQPEPKTSLEFIHSLHHSKEARIIDVGGGDSKLVDALMEEGFNNISVLDISGKAIERAKLRLGKQGEKVNWVISDILNFDPRTEFDIWHDRAAFHFLTHQEEIRRYISIAERAVKRGGHLVLATFSTSGPKSCSGLPVHQYDDALLAAELQNGFEKISCVTVDHTTPFNTKQNFLFCSFRRKAG